MNAQTDTVGYVPTQKIDALMDSDAAARWIGISSNTIRRWRSEGRGPRWIKVGRLAKYRMDDLHAWAASNVVEAGK